MNGVGRSKTFAEFFAGIGLVREALSQSGWDCVFANDIATKKREIYESRFGREEHFHLGDVWDTAEMIQQLQPRPFLATASFPCTDLSLAGHWRGLEGQHSSAFFGFCRIIEELGTEKPNIILLENVNGFLTSRDGADFECAVQSLAGLGYWIDAFTIDAKFFVPQSRPRVFVVAIDCNINDIGIGEHDWQQKNLFDEANIQEVTPSPIRSKRLVSLIQDIELPTGWMSLNLPTPESRHVSLTQIIDTDESQEWWNNAAVDKHYHMMSDRHRSHIDELLSRGDLHIGTIYRRKRHGKTRAETRFDGIAGCLRTPSGGSARQIVVVADNGHLRMRWMSPREYARLQGTPDYPLLKNVNQMLYGFGDAVCVPVVQWLDVNLLTPLFEHSMFRREQKVG